MQVVIDYDTSKNKGVIATDLLPVIREHFSVEDKASFFRNKRAVGYQIPTRKYCITPQGRFEPRLYTDIIQYISQEFTNMEIITSPIFKEKTKLPVFINDYLKLNMELRDYQRESVLAALKHGSGNIILPTSAGKTLVIATLAQTCSKQLNTKCLILVPDLQLASQTTKDLISYGVPEETVTKWTGGSEPDFSADIIIANSQILLSKCQDLSILKTIGVLIVDEAHKCASSTELAKLIKTLPAKVRFGFTGSFPEPLAQQWAIKSLLGPVIYKKKSVELREQGYISEVRVAAIRLTYKNVPHFQKPSMMNPTAGYEDEIQYLHTNEFRNSIIAKLISKVSNNTLVLVDRIIHGEHLLQYLESQFPDKYFCFIQGSVSVEDRETLRLLMEERKDIVAIAISKIFSTGLNIKNLHNIIFAAIGKSPIKVIQSIGRSLRLHKDKKEATIFDISDNLYYGNKHLNERLELYKKEQIPVQAKSVIQP